MPDELVEKLRAISMDDRRWGEELDIREAADALETQATRIEALVEALSFYADQWERHDEAITDGVELMPSPALLHDAGAKARAALQGESEATA